MAIVFETSTEDKFVRARGDGFLPDGTAWERAPLSAWWKKLETRNLLERRGAPVTDPIPVELLPSKVVLRKGKRLYDFNVYIDGPLCVSQRFKDAVEAIEPGVHQFVPIPIFHKDGSPYGESFYYFQICSLLDAINPALGGVYKQGGYDFENHPDRYVWFVQSGGDEKLAVFKNCVAGKAAWRDQRMYARWFFSDALVERMKAEGMEGYYAASYWHEI